MDTLFETAYVRARNAARRGSLEAETRTYNRYRPQRIPKALTVFSLIAVPSVIAVTLGVVHRW